jgi:two-component system sensor histidine kinase HydH
MTVPRITKRPEESLEAAGQGFAVLLRDCASCGLLLVGPGDTVRILNREAGEALNLPLKTPHRLSSMPESVRQAVSTALESGEASRVFTILRTASGEPCPVGVWAAPLAKGEDTVLVAINRFLQVGPLEPDLERLDRLANTGLLAAGLAHEIKNALVAVKTFTDLLLEKNAGAELAGMVRRELARVDSIVGRLLKFARPSAPTSTPVHLHETLDYALRLTQPQPGAIVLERSFKATLDTVQGDESQLHQAFVNILMNALDAMGPHGTLSVTTQNFTRSKATDPSTPSLRVVIKDTGPGISPENMARLFEPFFTTKSNGTGLGLVVARRIFAEHHGTVSVDSHSGDGATFTITLPVWEPDSPPPRSGS